MSIICTKAIIPVAGYGTRRLPVAKAVEKCMLPLLNRPIIDYVVEDCIKAGATDIYFVVSDGSQLKHYYSRDKDLENYLRTAGKEEHVPSIIPPEGVRFHYLKQDRKSDPRYGTSVPVWLAKDVISEGEHVLVVMGDQCFYRADGGSEAADLIEQVKQSDVNCGMVAVPVPPELVSSYGIIETDDHGNFVRIHEKPSIKDAPSNLNNASIYLFNTAMLGYVARDMVEIRASEHEIINPINAYVQDGHNITIAKAKGVYLDCGSVEKWVAANQLLLNESVTR